MGNTKQILIESIFVYNLTKKNKKYGNEMIILTNMKQQCTKINTLTILDFKIHLKF